MEQQLARMGQQRRDQERLSSETEQLLAIFQKTLIEKEIQEGILHEQLTTRDQEKENSQRQLREIQEQLRAKADQEVNLQRQLREVTQQLTSVQELFLEKKGETANLQEQVTTLEQQLRIKDQKVNKLKQRRGEMKKQLTSLQGQVLEKEGEKANLQNQVTILEQEVNELEKALSTTRQTLREHKRLHITSDWVISRHQIQLTDKLLGKGGWGEVVEGKYCGCSVAVKQIHELIISPHIQSLFEREMNIASRCRHPCLLQFIGATNDEESPLFVTELMELSLRSLLGQRPLAATEVSTISLDVARALNYLHQKEPSPILHRDISSANVLLWRHGDHWRGKVSDYGTANIMQNIMTVGPGAPIYMAPEACTSNQTVKVSYDLLKICYLSIK